MMIEQVFIDDYPSEVADWCDANGAYIEEIERDEEGRRRFQVKSLPADELAAQALEQVKAVRADAVSEILVKLDDMVFDGDEVAQNRIARTITALQATSQPDDYAVSWVLADGTVAQVTKAQLSQVLFLAGQEQTRLWVQPYL